MAEPMAPTPMKPTRSANGNTFLLEVSCVMTTER